MNLLDQQLQALQVKRAKIEVFSEIITNFGLLKEASDTAQTLAREEAIAEMTEILSAKIAALQSGQDQPEEKSELSAETNSIFSPQEVEILKSLCAKAVQRDQAQANKNAFLSDSPAPAPKKKQDILSFALAHRHLDGKRVVVTTKDGSVGGVVRGMLMPNIIVVTDTGHTAHVLPEQIIAE